MIVWGVRYEFDDIVHYVYFFVVFSVVALLLWKRLCFRSVDNNDVTTFVPEDVGTELV